MEKQELQIMPKLPRISDENLRTGKDFSFSFSDRNDLLLLFLSLCYNNQQNNSYETYNILFSCLEKNFPQNDPFLYAKFHYALMHPQKQADEVLEKIVRHVPEKDIYALLNGLSASSAFNSEQTKKLLSMLNRSESSQPLKKHLQNVFSIPKTPLQDFTAHIKKTISDSLAHHPSQELSHPLTDFQQNIYGLFSQCCPILNSHKNLRQELEHFFNTLQNQNYHITVVGEGKRGKSSLINALLQKPLSLVEESIPKTAVPIEFYYSETECCLVRFLDEKDLAVQKECILRQGLFHKQTELSPFSSGKCIKIHKHQLADYTDAEGKFVHQTAKIYIGTDNKLLKQGFHISDTPGLNCVNAFHDYLTFRESLLADCIIFVVDARKPDSASELNFLREITAKGRVVSIIGVITNTDRLNKQENADLAITRANLLFKEITANNPQIEFLGLIQLNPKMLMEHFCEQKHISKEQNEAWNTFLSYIKKAVKNNNHVQEYQNKIQNNAKALLRTIQAAVEKEQHTVSKTYPHSFVTILENHKQTLMLALEKYRTQAEQLILGAEKDIENWKKQQQAELDRFEKDFIQTLRLKTHEFADTLGADIAKSEKWKEFDQRTAKETAQKAVQNFIKNQEEQLGVWEEKIKIFHKNMHMLSNECLETVSLSVNSMGSTALESTTLSNILIHGNIKMKQLSLFLAGAGSGFALSASFFNLVTVGSLALAFLGDPISISGLVITGLGALTLHFKGDLQKHKKNILLKKQKKIEEWAKTVRAALSDAMQEKQRELSDQYRLVIKQSFLPSFELLFTETVHIHWYAEFIKKLQENTENEFRHTMRTLNAIQHVLEEKA